MVHAFRLYTGPDHASHVMEGTVALDERAMLSRSASRNPRRIHRSTGTTRRSRNM